MPEEPRATIQPLFRLLPHQGWPDQEDGQSLRIDGGALRLGLAGSRSIPFDEDCGSFGGLRLPRGLAIGRDGRLFLADPEGGVVLTALAAEIGRGANDAEAFRPLWPRREDPADPYHLITPTDLAIGPHDSLLIADPTAAKVLILDLPSGVIRGQWLRPTWQPIALAVDDRQRVYVADRAGDTIHRFDAHGRRDPDFPKPGTVIQQPSGLALQAPDICSPRAMAFCGESCGARRTPDSRDPFLFVLGTAGVTALNHQGRVVSATPEALLPPALEPVPGGLTYADPTESTRKPLRIVTRNLTRRGGIEGLNPAITLVVMPQRIQVPRSGHLIFQPLDSGRNGFAWDRIALSLTMPPTCRLVVEVLTSNNPIQGDRIAEHFKVYGSGGMALGPGDLPEIPIQAPPGRYLWLKLTLMGDGFASPSIDRIDIFGPRVSSLNSLPPPFHQDPESRHFLDRFLSYFDTIFAELRAANREVPALFDPLVVPEGDWLDWLGSWFDLEFLAEWDQATRRQMITTAIEQARARGTCEGLGRMVRWHLKLQRPWPMLIEHFRLGPSSPPLAHQPLPTAPEPHRVTVVLPRARVAADSEPRLRQLVDSWLPAHVCARLVFIEAGIVIGRQSLLGIDTLLGGLGPQPLGHGRAGLDLSSASPPSGGVMSTCLPSGVQHD